ncbi:hypothetical protein I6H96_02755 [Brucella anthropi]|uniref:hypothetical protein n=1 Tax=Brucella anthropi TaxID=529 RepID=UPI0002FEBA30|nr:hypothetical protein [Brucella anthropi]QQC25801.1 hypothetical protein I6H96_02755 [Brucella anthropi]SUA65378.1 Uncharacterised protein [Brucella anthropi]
MKIAARIDKGTYLVEMTTIEVARAAGFTDDWDSEFNKAAGQYVRENGLRIGTQIEVNAAYTFHRRISENSEKAKNSANVLRALAEMLESGLPHVVLPPAEETPKPEGAGGAGVE